MLDIAIYQITNQYLKGRKKKVRKTKSLNKKYKFKGQNSAKNYSTRTKFKLKTVTHLDIATYQISSQYLKGRKKKVRTT
jgi:hypothetical protein